MSTSPFVGAVVPRLRLLFSEGYFESQCFALWDAHLIWLQKLGFKDALREEPQAPISGGFGHEVVDLLARYIERTGRVNAHLGLTSSDIVDNVRLVIVQESLRYLSSTLDGFTQALLARVRPVFGHRTVGFTHWQPAAPIDWEHRVRAWVAPLNWLATTRPPIFGKHFAGAVGDAASLKLILGDAWGKEEFDWTPFDLEYPNNPWPLQSSDHSCEMNAVNWVCAVSAQVHKIAADLRFLASHGFIKLPRPEGHAGSSCMAHKLNPYKWEKVCSLTRSVSTTQQEMWSVAAHNGLERTLDTSWQLKHLLHRAFFGLGEALDIMIATEFSVVAGNVVDASALMGSEEQLTRRVLAGESRWSAYLSQLASQPTTSQETTP